MKCIHLGGGIPGKKTEDGRQVMSCQVHNLCTTYGENFPYASCSSCSERATEQSPTFSKDWYDPLVFTDRTKEPTNAMRNMLNGGCAFLVCGGPSTRELDLSLLDQKGVWSLAVNNMAAAYRANGFVCSDPPEKFHDGIWLDPQIMKFLPLPKLSQGKKGKLRKKEGDEFFDLEKRTADCPNVWGFERRAWMQPDDHSFFTEPSASWGNLQKGVDLTGESKSVCTMLLGIRLLYYLGARKIFFVGIDMQMKEGVGAKDNYSFGEIRDSSAIRSNNNIYRNVVSWLDRIQKAGSFEKFGLEIYNCNPKSAIRSFPHVSFEDAIAYSLKEFPVQPFDLVGWYEKK